MVQEGLHAVTDKKVIEISPKDVVSKSKIYNLVGAMQFKELFALDFIKDYKATPLELNQAKTFYDEFVEYRKDKEPGEEYEIVQHWAEDLRLAQNFELVDENEFRSKRTDIDHLLSSIEKDPLDTKSKDLQREREMEKFQKFQQALGTNMAVVMFMVDALEFFNKKSKKEIAEIAREIAMQGRFGYQPDREGYILNTIPGKEFSGYHILAYYYVSWSLAFPEVVGELGLPYEEEYKMAQSLFQGGE